MEHEKRIYTTAGALGFHDFALALPHEHIFTETGEGHEYAYKDAEYDEVLRAMRPYLEAAKRAGASLLCEATPIGVGRRPDIVAEVARAVDLPVALATGFYCDPRVTDDIRQKDSIRIIGQLVHELNVGIDQTGIRAGFIKIGTSAEGMTSEEARLTRVAAEASRRTGALICSHTPSGAVAEQQVKILLEHTVDPSRFAWFHASMEKEYKKLTQMASLGVYLGLDLMGDEESMDGLRDRFLRLRADGFSKNVLISMDAGWFNPREERGGEIRGYTDLFECFIPRARAKGVLEEEIYALMHDNVYHAYAR